MFSTNPFSILSETVPLIGIQSFVVIMVALVILGTVLDMIHKKNVKYFFNNARKAKKNAKRELGSGERIAVIAKTIVHDIGTTSELGLGKRRIAHVLFQGQISQEHQPEVANYLLNHLLRLDFFVMQLQAYKTYAQILTNTRVSYTHLRAHET